MAESPNQETRCPHCSANLKSYWHSITPGLVKTLVKFYVAVVAKNRNSIHVPKEVTELTKSEYNNFQKLRFHTLVAKVKEDGVRKIGYWLITKRGAQFLKGQIAIPFKVKTFRNRVEGHSEDHVSVKDVIGTIPYFESIDDFEWDLEFDINNQTGQLGFV